MMLSKKLLQGVLKEARLFPKHAFKVITSSRKVEPHQKYFYGKQRKQYLCWFEPKEPTTAPLIIFFHGGAWTFGSPEMFSNRARLFIKKGYRVIMPAHRKLPKFDYNTIREDLILMMRKVKVLMKEKGISNQKIILSGMSSGGNLAALLLLEDTLLKETGFASNDFIGAFFCAAPLNLAGMTDSFVLDMYAGKKDSDSFRLASPINHLQDDFSTPLLIIHGTQDGIVRFQSTLDFVEKLKRINPDILDFYTIQKGSHLDAVSWAYKNNATRKVILNWLERISLRA